MKRIAAVILALVAVLGLSLRAPQPAAADGVIGGGAKIVCQAGGAGVLGDLMGLGDDFCDFIGKSVQKKVDEAWKSVWDSVLGDVINSAADVVKWIIKKVITVALLGPSLDLEATGLFGRHATLAGMLTWLGLVIATLGAIWQIGKMAVTGQSKHIGRALLGWMESTILSAVGVGLIAILVTAGDALTTGLVNATFDSGGDAYKLILATLVPAAVANPITMLCVVAVLLLIGFIQLIMVFLRQSAIPILCLLLPVAGGGRVGGDTTRQWAPRLITSICVVIAYKPILAIIICTGFSEFGHAQTLAEWLRGCATLVLAILAPGPLTRLFAPFGEAVGSGMASGGIAGGFAGAAGFFMGKDSGGSSGGGDAPASAVQHAQYVEQSMGSQSGRGGDAGEAGRDAQSQASRNNSQAASVPAQDRETAGAGPAAGTGGAGATGGNGAAGAAAGGAGAAAAAGIAIQVLDGVNNSAGQIGDGGNTQ
ncbi:hypothetical protein [Streptomyces sp. NPDC004579]|uniref:hypothetical protein n=1 Tax=Streptomyces sp. NPDC004579 TaxID=3154667 RepID=UPI0033BE0ABB